MTITELKSRISVHGKLKVTMTNKAMYVASCTSSHFVIKGYPQYNIREALESLYKRLTNISSELYELTD